MSTNKQIKLIFNYISLKNINHQFSNFILIIYKFYSTIFILIAFLLLFEQKITQSKPKTLKYWKVLQSYIIIINIIFNVNIIELLKNVMSGIQLLSERFGITIVFKIFKYIINFIILLW